MKIESFTAVTAALLLALSTGCAGDDDNGGATGSATAGMLVSLQRLLVGE